MTTTRTRVHWTDADRQKIAGVMFEFWKTNPFLSPKQTYYAVKDKLPEELRRDILGFTVNQVGILQTAYTKLVRDHIAAGGAGGDDVAPQIIEVVKEVMPDPFTALARIPSKFLFAECFERMSGNFAEAMRVVAHHEPASNGHHHAPAPPPPPVTLGKLPRIAVIGLFSEQFGHLEERLKAAGKADQCELKFYDKDKRAKTITADYAIVQRHTSHMWWDKARSELSEAKNVFFVQGGIDMTLQKVLDILSRQPK